MTATTLSRTPAHDSGWACAYVRTLFYLMPFADAATGYMVLSGSFAEAAAGSISQLLRATLLIPALLLLKGRATYAAVLPIFYVLSFESLLLMLHQQMGWFVVSTIYGFKLIYLLVSYFALREVSQQPEPIDIPAYFIHGASLYGVILVLSTVAGLSTPTYSEGNFGSKGLFASGNGLALYLGCAALLALARTSNNRRSLAMLEVLFLLMCCLLVGTKASMIFGSVFAGIVLKRASMAWKLLILGIVTTGALFFTEQIAAAFALIFDVILFRFEASESVFTFIASGRDLYVSEALDSFNVSGLASLRLAFGAGAFVSFRDLNAGLTEYDTLESDFFDIFFGYGAIGLVSYLAIIIWGIRLAMKSRQSALLLVWACTCLYSAAAGHVAFNAMSGMAIPVLIIALQSPRQSRAGAYA